MGAGVGEGSEAEVVRGAAGDVAGRPRERGDRFDVSVGLEFTPADEAHIERGTE
jgi:hypothetical protein